MKYITNYLHLIQDNFLYIVIIALVVIVAVVIIIIRYNLFHRIMDMWKPDSDRTIALRMFCDDQSIRDRKGILERFVVSDHNKRKAFYLIHKLQLRNKGSDAKFLAVTERDARPIDFLGVMAEVDWKACPSATKIWDNATADVNSSSARSAGGNFTMTALAIMAACTTLLFIVGAIVFMIGG